MEENDNKTAFANTDERVHKDFIHLIKCSSFTIEKDSLATGKGPMALCVVSSRQPFFLREMDNKRFSSKLVVHALIAVSLLVTIVIENAQRASSHDSAKT